MSSRTIKHDEENEVEKRRMQIYGLKKSDTAKENSSKVPKRAALGELGNRAVSLTRPSVKDPNSVKASDYKHVKPRVDCHWKGKNEKEKKVDLIQKKIDHLRRHIPSIKAIEEVKLKTDPPKIVITHPSDEFTDHCQAVTKKTAIKTPIQIKSHSQKLLRQIEDIDNGNENLFLVNDYANDVYNYLFDLENKNYMPEKYLESHVEITPTMRTILIDWLNETHDQFQLVVETYFLTIALVDMYLCKHPDTKRKHLQLVGCTSMFIAAKYEEVYAPEIKEFVYITDKSYSEKQICHMERAILKAVNFQLGQPLAIQFLRRFSKAANAEAAQHLMGKYFIELVSIEYSMVHYKKSLISAASLYLAIHIYKSEITFNPKYWTSTLEYYSTYVATDLKPVALQIIKLIKNAPKSSKNKYHAIYTKYSSSKNEGIAKKLNEHKARMLLDSLQGQNVLKLV